MNVVSVFAAVRYTMKKELQAAKNKYIRILTLYIISLVNANKRIYKFKKNIYIKTSVAIKDIAKPAIHSKAPTH